MDQDKVLLTFPCSPSFFFQIYKTEKKVDIDVQCINVSALDFREAMAAVTPAAQVQWQS